MEKLAKTLIIISIVLVPLAAIFGMAENKYFEFQCLRGKEAYCQAALYNAISTKNIQKANKILETKCYKYGGWRCSEYAQALFLQNKELEKDIFSKLDNECSSGDYPSCNNLVSVLYLKSGFHSFNFKPELFLSNTIKSIGDAKKSCDKNYGSMCFATALKYQYGLLGKKLSAFKRLAVARSYAQKGCDLGFGDACFALINYLPEKVTVQDKDLIEKACKMDSYAACAMLGAVYERGSLEYTAAITKACSNLYFIACSELGNYFISIESLADGFFLKSISCNFGSGCEELDQIDKIYPKRSFGKESGMKDASKTRCQKGDSAACFMYLMDQQNTKAILERGRTTSSIKGRNYLPISYTMDAEKQKANNIPIDTRPKEFIGCGRIDGPANVRIAPNGSVLKQISNDKYVRVFGKKEKWLKIDLEEWNDQSICMYENVFLPKNVGWIHSQNIQPSCSLDCD